MNHLEGEKGASKGSKKSKRRQPYCPTAIAPSFPNTFTVTGAERFLLSSRWETMRTEWRDDEDPRVEASPFCLRFENIVNFTDNSLNHAQIFIKVSFFDFQFLLNMRVYVAYFDGTTFKFVGPRPECNRGGNNRVTPLPPSYSLYLDINKLYPYSQSRITCFNKTTQQQTINKIHITSLAWRQKGGTI